MVVFAALTLPADEAALNTLEMLVLFDVIELMALSAGPEIEVLIGLAGINADPEILAPIKRLRSFA